MAGTTVTKVGDYEVLVSGSAVAFWPLDPWSSLAGAVSPIVVAPSSGSSAGTVVTTVVGVFDIAIAVAEGLAESEVAPVTLPPSPGGKASIKKAPLFGKVGQTMHLRFAVDHGKLHKTDNWSGSLRLSSKTASGGAVQTNITLAVAYTATVSNLFVFFAPNTKLKKNAWVTLEARQKGGGAVANASVDLKVLRDNLNSGYAGVNRRAPLTTNGGGQVVSGTARPILSVPVDWPVIFTFTSGAHVTGAHMIRLDKDAADENNLNATEIGPAVLVPRAAASLEGKTFILDAGHGVVYGYTKARRCQEWYVAHRVADRIRAILMSEHKVNADDIYFTRSAGFGLIEPSQVHSNAAPEGGEAKYKVDLPHKKIAAKTAAVGLHDLAKLLLTTHSGDHDTADTLSSSDYEGFLGRNTATVNAIIARVNGQLGATHARVQPGSVTWDDDQHRYVYTKEKQKAAGGWEEAGTTTLPITTNDWFALDSQAIAVLADRSARWSLAAEVGGGPALGGKSFASAARAALKAAGALDYFRQKILFYVNVTAPHSYLDHGTKGWGPSERAKFFNDYQSQLSAAGTPLSMVLTLHENAGKGKGGMVLVSHKSGPDEPPDDQVRIAKTMVKYLDPFDHGTRSGGVSQDLPANPAGMLYHGNQVRGLYAYFESEFMDATDPKDPTRFSYEAMVEPPFIEALARQVVSGVVEWLLAPQVDLDDVKYMGGSIKGLW